MNKLITVQVMDHNERALLVNPGNIIMKSDGLRFYPSKNDQIIHCLFKSLMN